MPQFHPPSDRNRSTSKIIFHDVESQTKRKKRMNVMPDILDSETFQHVRNSTDPTLAKRVEDQNSISGISGYFMTNCYVFFLAICKDFDFMSWITIMKRGFATNDDAVIMVMIFSIVGFTTGFFYFAYKACQTQQRFGDKEDAYQDAMEILLENECEVKKSSPQELAECDLAIQQYALLYGKPDGTVFTVILPWHFVPMLGVLSFVKFYTRENNDADVARLLRASSLRTLILINSWSTIGITIPCVFVIVYLFAFGGVTFAEADMFTKFSAFQAVLSIVLTFSAMGIPGFEDGVVDVLKNADALSYDRIQMKQACLKLFKYWKEWHLDLAELLMCFRTSDIGTKTSVNGEKIVIDFPNNLEDLEHPVWKDRLNGVWKQRLLTLCKKYIAKYKSLNNGNIHQESEITETLEDILHAWQSQQDDDFWQSIITLYAKVCACSTEAARQVQINQEILGFPKDQVENSLAKKYKKIEDACLYKTPLLTLQPNFQTKLDDFYQEKTL